MSNKNQIFATRCATRPSIRYQNITLAKDVRVLSATRAHNEFMKQNSKRDMNRNRRLCAPRLGRFSITKYIARQMFCVVDNLGEDSDECCYAIVMPSAAPPTEKNKKRVTLIDFDTLVVDENDVTLIDQVPEVIVRRFVWYMEQNRKGFFDETREFWFMFICLFYHDRPRFIETYVIDEENYPVDAIDYVLRHRVLFYVVLLASVVQAVWTTIKTNTYLLVLIAVYLFYYLYESKLAKAALTESSK